MAAEGNFFTKYWNVLTNIAIGLIVVISKFAIPPAINAHILQDKVDYEKLSIFVLSGILGLMLIPCTFFKAKKYTLKWATAALMILIAAYFTHRNYNSYYNIHTAWYQEAQTEVIVGDGFIPIAQKAIDAYKKTHDGKEPSKDIIVSSFNYPDGLWSKDEMGRVYENIVIRYLAQVILFSLFAFFVVQSLSCLNTTPKVISEKS